MFKKLCTMAATPLAALLLTSLSVSAAAQEAPMATSNVQRSIEGEALAVDAEDDEVFYSEQHGTFMKRSAAR